MSMVIVTRYIWLVTGFAVDFNGLLSFRVTYIIWCNFILCTFRYVNFIYSMTANYLMYAPVDIPAEPLCSDKYC